MDKSVIGFTKVALPYGWLGNMSPFPIEYEGVVWRTTEALFQALRFSDPTIKEEIRLQKSPMAAKMIAKKNRELFVVSPMSEEDLSNMRMCINLKLDQHPSLKEELVATGTSLIFEDVTSRGSRGSNLFWGAMVNDGKLIGSNELGKIWMSIRDK